MSNPYSMPQSELTEAGSNDTYMPKFFALSGRIGRVRYLGYSFAAGLLMFPVMIVLMVVGGMFTAAAGAAGARGAAAGLGILSMVVISGLSLAVTFILARRRLNDLGQTGWLGLLVLIPLVGFIFWLWLIFGPGDSDSNEYGPAPAPNTTGVIVLAWFLPIMIVVMIGIMASVAIPAYSQYMQKARAAQMQQGQ